MKHAKGFAGLAIAGGLLLVVPGHAKADPAYDRCIDEARDDTQFAACGDQWVEREDRSLNAAWRELLPLVENPADHEALVAEQRAWIAFKDQSCNFLYSEYWGALGRQAYFPRCRAAVIAARTAELRESREMIDPPAQ